LNWAGRISGCFRRLCWGKARGETQQAEKEPAMESRRPVMGMPTAIAAGVAFLVAAVVIAKVFDSPLSVIILAAMVLIVYAVMRVGSKNAR
jgi:hypothetical protein